MKREWIQEGMGNYLKVTDEGEETISDKIFSFQEIPGFLPLEIRWINGEKECIYDISGRVSLAEYLSETVFTERDIRHILLQILNMGTRLEEYLLDSNSLVIHEEYLFIDKGSGQVAGIYNPGLRSGDIQSLARLLEYIMEKMNQKDEGLIFFIYGLHKLVKGAGCTKALIKDFIEAEKESIKPREKVSSFCQIPAMSPEMQDKKALPPSSYIIPGIFLAAGIFIIVILWTLGFFQKPLSGQTDWIKLTGAACFFLAVCGYGAWKTMPPAAFGKNRRDVVKYEQEKESKKVCLIPKMGKGEMIEINTFPFRIGEVAKILQEGSDILVTDEESETGTYRNNERLVPWQKTILHDGDFLCLAGHEYVVEITQSEYVI